MRNLLCLGCLFFLACSNAVDGPKDEGDLARSFRLASDESGVPRDLLLAVGFVESRWQMHDGVVDDEHRPSFGIMGLSDPAAAARRLGIDPQDARSVPDQNIRTAAEVLRAIAADADGHVPKTITAWRTALAQYGAFGDDTAGSLYADDVFHVLDTGADAVASTGERIVLVGRGKSAGTAKAEQALNTDSSLAVQFVPAHDGFFHVGRWGTAIDRVVIHTTEGSYEGTIGWFRNPANPYMTSAHYVVRSSDGEITQMVKETDAAYHVLNWNPRAIGIEHEAISSQPEWFTDAMYASSANLVKDICARWGIPMDRTHIVGHVEVPGNDHTDPGHYWDWDRYMSLLNDGAPPAPPPPAADACDGLDYAGACDGDTLSWCENNSVRSMDCASSGKTCGWQDDATGNNCVAAAAAPPPPPPPVADPCDGLDFAGACNGDTLSWCQDGAPRSFDCASTGQTCGWQDDATGNNCVATAAPPPPPASSDPCNGLDYAGVCDGNVLDWCENGAPQSFDCASSGQACGWQSDAVGNNCL